MVIAHISAPRRLLAKRVNSDPKSITWPISSQASQVITRGFTNAQIQDTSGTTTDLLLDGQMAPGSPPSWMHLYKAGTGHLETWDGTCS